MRFRRICRVVDDGRSITSMVLRNYNAIKQLSTPTGFKILSMLAKRGYYPTDIAKTLGISKQLVYHYIKHLEEDGLIVKTGEEEIRGARAQVYRFPADAITLVLNNSGWRREKRTLLPEKLHSFLHPLVRDEQFNGIVVVGSPHPHGPHRTVASDGHYVFQLGLFLGQYTRPPEEFKVRLDVDVKAEKLYDDNMILVGGPGANLITAMVNHKLPIRFNESNYWAGIVSSRQIYTAESCGIIAKVRMENGKYAIVLAGLRAPGTKAAIIMLTNKYEELLKNYGGEDEWAAVIMGLDLNGDGKIDSAELLETT